MNYDVTIDRGRYIGGSDIPCLMGISPFKTRWQLLLEKAGLAESDFSGNKYTTYGEEMEPKIREYINELYFTDFEPNRVIDRDFRYHSDGFNGEAVLEIKTTSSIFGYVENYEAYLVQLLKGMELNKVSKGLLAVYHRPEDFNTEFDENRLYVYEVLEGAHTLLMERANAEIDRFRSDLSRLKGNPLLSEEDFQPNEVVVLSSKILAFETRLSEYKEIERQYKDMKQQLYEAMVRHDIKSWETVGGVKITRVDEVKPTVELVEEFDEAEFACDYPDLFKEYCKQVEKKKTGRTGYVKITVPKGV